MSPISVTPISGDLDGVCLNESEDTTRRRILHGKSEKTGSKAEKHSKSGKSGSSLQPECYNSAGKYRTCFHRGYTPYTCDTISSGKPHVSSDEALITGIMHVTLLQDGTDVTCQKKIQLEKALLTYLADNVGSDSTFEPVCVYASESAQSKQLVPDSSGQYAESTAIKIQVQYIQKREWEYLDNAVRDLQSKKCTRIDKALCCSQHAVNSYIGEYCASLGCNLKKCGSGRKRRKPTRKLSKNASIASLVQRRTGKADKASKASLFYSKSSKSSGKSFKSGKADHHYYSFNACPWYGMFHGDDFNEVMNKYSLFQPEETFSLLDIKDTTSCAICSANRYSINEHDTPSLSCGDYVRENCPENEDLPSELDTSQPIEVMTPTPVLTTPSPQPKPTDQPEMTEPPSSQSLSESPNLQNSISPTLPQVSNEPTLSVTNPPQNVLLPSPLTAAPADNSLPTLPPAGNLPTLPPVTGVQPTLPPNLSSPQISVAAFTPAPSSSTITESPWDFESGVFPEIPWRTGGEGVWTIDTQNVDTGSYSIKSPALDSNNIDGPQVSNATLTLDSSFEGGLVKARILAR